MKVDQSAALPGHLHADAVQMGERIARLRVARQIKQTEAAIRAGLSRNTAYRIERGDPGLAVGQLLRYLDAIAPGMTLAELLTERDPALMQQQREEQRQRVRGLTQAELDELDF
ncbi:helix-turn-helix transcriptional regulator [Roseateles sp.]|jgi:transcriptional regulator with XRE-family HTH domain|uniref:helix-turn-helix domain-containing protein n=1 Tax=Roseateles sp. TaxID=1971397 RepID=UPI0031E11400